MAFYKKRDHTQIIADILNSCKNPQTKTNIRYQTNISYAVLQSCLIQLLLSKWLEIIEENSGQKKLTTTEKGLVFLDKYVEIQGIVGAKTKNELLKSKSILQTVMAK